MVDSVVEGQTVDRRAGDCAFSMVGQRRQGGGVRSPLMTDGVLQGVDDGVADASERVI